MVIYDCNFVLYMYYLIDLGYAGYQTEHSCVYNISNYKLVDGHLIYTLI